MKVEQLPDTHVMAEFIRERRDDGYWIGYTLSDGRSDFAGPFETEEAANRALDDLQKMSLSLGGTSVPGGIAN